MSHSKDPREEQATDLPLEKTRDDGTPPKSPGGVQPAVPPTGLDSDAKNAASRF